MISVLVQSNNEMNDELIVQPKIISFRGEIDTSTPFKSVKEAIAHVDGMSYWKPPDIESTRSGPSLDNVSLETGLITEQAMDPNKDLNYDQNEYKRGLSGWNFNLEDVKAQASLIQDEDTTSENSQGGSSNSVCKLDGHEKQSEHLSQIAEMEDNDLVLEPDPTSLADSTIKIAKVRCDRSDDDSSITSPSYQHHVSAASSPHNDDHVENNLGEKPALEISRRSTEAVALPSHRRTDASASSNLPESYIPPIKGESCNGATVPPTGDDALPENPSKASRSSANSDDFDEKAKPPFVQQRGRFQVTSENVEKVVPSPILQKSHSMQEDADTSNAIANEDSSSSLAAPPPPASPVPRANTQEDTENGDVIIPITNEDIEQDATGSLGLVAPPPPPGVPPTIMELLMFEFLGSLLSGISVYLEAYASLVSHQPQHNIRNLKLTVMMLSMGTVALKLLLAYVFRSRGFWNNLFHDFAEGCDTLLGIFMAVVSTIDYIAEGEKEDFKERMDRSVPFIFMCGYLGYRVTKFYIRLRVST